MLLPRHTGHVPAFEIAILQEANRHSARLGKDAIDASNASWIYDDAVRTVRNSQGEQRHQALVHLAKMNAEFSA